MVWDLVKCGAMVPLKIEQVTVWELITLHGCVHNTSCNSAVPKFVGFIVGYVYKSGAMG